MLNFATSREIAAHELENIGAVANHLAAALIPFSSCAELQRTLGFNELCTGILGHHLRDPLSAMITAAQAAMMRPEAEKLARPLSRIHPSHAVAAGEALEPCRSHVLVSVAAAQCDRRGGWPGR